MDSEFYKYFGLSNVPRNYKNNQEVYNLFKTPKKDKISPVFYNFEKDHTHQADLLFMPDDKGYKYCLCVVDVGFLNCFYPYFYLISFVLISCKSESRMVKTCICLVFFVFLFHGYLFVVFLVVLVFIVFLLFLVL